MPPNQFQLQSTVTLNQTDSHIFGDSDPNQADYAARLIRNEYLAVF